MKLMNFEIRYNIEPQFEIGEPKEGLTKNSTK